MSNKTNGLTFELLDIFFSKISRYLVVDSKIVLAKFHKKSVENWPQNREKRALQVNVTLAV